MTPTKTETTAEKGTKSIRFLSSTSTAAFLLNQVSERERETGERKEKREMRERERATPAISLASFLPLLHLLLLSLSFSPSLLYISMNIFYIGDPSCLKIAGKVYVAARVMIEPSIFLPFFLPNKLLRLN
jgi:hypothetical protein